MQGEKRLAIAIIKAAVDDASSSTPNAKKKAELFLRGKRETIWFDLAELTPLSRETTIWSRTIKGRRNDNGDKQTTPE